MAKGQLTSKCLFGIFKSPKKGTKKFDVTCKYGASSQIVSFVFWENWRHQKNISKLTDLYKPISTGVKLSPENYYSTPHPGFFDYPTALI